MKNVTIHGHYSIDIIVGWLVAVYVTNPAEKLGSYLSTIQTEKDIDVYKWALEKDWLADIMYAEVNATGGKTISRDSKKTPTHFRRSSICAQNDEQCDVRLLQCVVFGQNA